MNYAIILAAGSGTRMESHDLAKCFISVYGKLIYQYSLETFLSMSEIDHVILVVPQGFTNEIKSHYLNEDKLDVIAGGNTRQESVFNALSFLKDKALADDIVLIHDAARPLVSKNIIKNNIEAAKEYGACMTAIKAIDTIVKSVTGKVVGDVLNRKILYAEQTPASFRYDLIYNAHLKAKDNILDASDDCVLLFNQNEKIHLVEGERNNFKITNEIDLKLFESLINH